MSFRLKIFASLTIFSSIAGVWLLGQIEKRARCFRSNSVESIYFMERVEKLGIATYQPQKISFCNLDNLYSVNKELPSLLESLQENIKKFEELADSLQWKYQKVKVFIFSDKTLLYSVQPSEIRASIQVLGAKRQLFKGLVSAWLLQSNPLLIDDTPLFEAWSDFFTAVAYGGKSVVNPLTGHRYLYKKDWSISDFLFSSLEICPLVWAPITYLNFCESVKKQKIGGSKSTKKKLSAFSLRPVLGHFFWESYITKNVGERVPWLKLLSKKLQGNLVLDKEYGYDLSNYSEWQKYLEKRLSVLLEKSSI